jgi:hypothetical protein
MKKKGKYARGRSKALLCAKCGHRGPARESSSGPHIKASCAQCGAYIKFMGKPKAKQDEIVPGPSLEEAVETGVLYQGVPVRRLPPGPAPKEKPVKMRQPQGLAPKYRRQGVYK